MDQVYLIPILLFLGLGIVFASLWYFSEQYQEEIMSKNCTELLNSIRDSVTDGGFAGKRTISNWIARCN